MTVAVGELACACGVARGTTKGVPRCFLRGGKKIMPRSSLRPEAVVRELPNGGLVEGSLATGLPPGRLAVVDGTSDPPADITGMPADMQCLEWSVARLDAARSCESCGPQPGSFDGCGIACALAGAARTRIPPAGASILCGPLPRVGAPDLATIAWAVCPGCARCTTLMSMSVDVGGSATSLCKGKRCEKCCNVSAGCSR